MTEKQNKRKNICMAKLIVEKDALGEMFLKKERNGNYVP